MASKNKNRATNSGLIYGVIAASKLWRYTLYSSVIKISLRNSGSFLGPLWEPLSTLIISLLLSAVWMKVLDVEGSFIDYFIYVYLGMVIWACLSGAVSNLCATLVRNAKSITSRTLPLFSYILEAMLTSFIPFFMSLPILILVLWFSDYMPSLFDFGFFLLGLCLMFLASFAFSISIGLVAFFIGDIRQVVTSVMRLSFLVTPVIWKPERLGDSEHLLLLNPFYGFLHILRNSMLDERLQFNYVYQAVLITLVLMIVGIITYNCLKGKIQNRALVL